MSPILHGHSSGAFFELYLKRNRRRRRPRISHSNSHNQSSKSLIVLNMVHDQMAFPGRGFSDKQQQQPGRGQHCWHHRCCCCAVSSKGKQEMALAVTPGRLHQPRGKCPTKRAKLAKNVNNKKVRISHFKERLH